MKLNFSVILVLLVCFIPKLKAEDFPSKAVRLVVPYAPGGGLDVIGRPITQKMSERYSVPFLLDNRPGGGTSIGTQIVAKADPDGHTLLLTLSALTIGPSIYKNFPYDPIKSFSPVIWIGTSSYILSIHPSVPVKNVRELINLSRRYPTKFNYSSTGNGTDTHMAAELLKNMAGVQWLHIPFSGGGPAAMAVIGGQVELTVLPTSFGAPLIKAGRVRALAICNVSRSTEFPDLPTISESGVPGYSADAWSGILAPANTTSKIVNQLNEDIKQIVLSQEYSALLKSRMVEPVATSVSHFTRRIYDDVNKWKNLAKAGHLKLD